MNYSLQYFKITLPVSAFIPIIKVIPKVSHLPLRDKRSTTISAFLSSSDLTELDVVIPYREHLRDWLRKMAYGGC